MATKHKSLKEIIAEVKKLPTNSVHNLSFATQVTAFPGCCGINVIHGLPAKLKADSFAFIASELKRWHNKSIGLVYLTDNKKRPDFEAIGFSLKETFRNPKTGSTIRVYAAKYKDTFGKLSMKEVYRVVSPTY